MSKIKAINKRLIPVLLPIWLNESSTKLEVERVLFHNLVLGLLYYGKWIILHTNSCQLDLWIAAQSVGLKNTINLNSTRVSDPLILRGLSVKSTCQEMFMIISCSKHTNDNWWS